MMPSFRVFLACCCLSLLAGPASAQDVVPDQDEASELARSVEFERLNSRYKNDLESWSIEENRLRKSGVPKAQLPKHPGYRYQALFGELAERGEPQARVWMIKNPAFHGETVTARREVLQRWYRALVRENSEGDFMREVIEELAGSPRRLGLEFALETLAEISERCKNSEYVAASLYHRAWLLSEGMRTKDPERRAEAMEIFMVLVTGYPDAKDAALAAGILYNVESTALRLALHDWCDACRASLAEGEEPAQWPRNPMHQFKARMEILAAGGSGQAQQWTAQFYPAFDQRDRVSRELGSLWLGQEFSNRRSSAEHPWMDLKFDILGLVAEICNEKDWAFDLVKGLDEEVPFFLPERYSPVLRKILDVASEARVREQASLTLARALAKGRTYPELREGLSIFQELEGAATVERISKEAEEHREALERVMPGALAPPLNAKDAEGLAVDLEQYKGKVVLLWFWSFNRQEQSHFEELGALKERLASEEFALLGVNCDLRNPRTFQRQAKANGISWRNALQYRALGHMTEAYSIHHWPTAILIDAEGVIRGRSLGLEACEELARALLKAGE